MPEPPIRRSEDRAPRGRAFRERHIAGCVGENEEAGAASVAVLREQLERLRDGARALEKTTVEIAREAEPEHFVSIEEVDRDREACLVETDDRHDDQRPRDGKMYEVAVVGVVACDERAAPATVVRPVDVPSDQRATVRRRRPRRREHRRAAAEDATVEVSNAVAVARRERACDAGGLLEEPTILPPATERHPDGQHERVHETPEETLRPDEPLPAVAVQLAELARLGA